MASLDLSSALVPFGFTGLESEIYAFLVGESSATGYRIAQAIGKPVANTYKAIQTLQTKGAIIVEEGSSRLCRAIPSDELLERLGREFEKKRLEAKSVLARVAKAQSDDRIYHIRSRVQALHRAVQMLSDAKKIALLAAKSDVVESLSEDLIAATARGVEVQVKTDNEVPIPRVETFVSPDESDLLNRHPLFHLVTDGSAYLIGKLPNSEEDAEIIWSQNPEISLLHHDGLAAEITLLIVKERIEDGAGPKRLAKALTQVPSASRTPGGIRLHDQSK